MTDYKKLITPEMKEGFERAVDFLKSGLNGGPNLQIKYLYGELDIIFSVSVLSDDGINIMIYIKEYFKNDLLALSDLSKTVDDAINTLKEK